MKARGWSAGSIVALLILAAAPLASAATDTLSAIRLGRLVVEIEGGPRMEGRALSLEGGPMRLSVAELGAQWLDGRLSLEPVTRAALGDGQVLILTIDGVALVEMAHALAIDGLSGEGRFDGRLPFVVGPAGETEMRQGSLASRDGGIVRYDPEQVPAALAGQGGGVALLLEALQNFHYDRLSVTLDGRLDDEMQIGLHIAGRNPDLYGGHPFELNINLEGAIGVLVQHALRAYQLPALLAKRAERLLR